jgi:uncharacterized membrane protein (DUF2068 family)
MRTVLAVALGLEALVAIEGLARFVAVAAAYDGTVWLLAAMRAAVTAIQVAAAWMLWEQRPPAPLFARVAVLSSAVLLTLEVGARLAPSNLAPGTRGPVLVGYWVYAVIAVFVLRRQSTD